MKKLFTLLVLMACFMGAKAVEIVDAEVDFSKYSDISEWNFPFSWGGSESARARLSIVDGCLHFHSDEATDPTWDCQFFPIGGVNAEVDVTYTLHFKVKGDHEENVSMLGFGQTPYGAFPITTEWVEGTVDYVCTSADGNILMQCGGWIGDWDIAYLKITHEGKEERPIEWIEMLTNGDAEKSWAEMGLDGTRFDDMENNYKICAWGKEREVNMNAEGTGWDPFPATIEDDGTGNHVFVVHGPAAITEGDASAWDNQFWIEAPRQIKEGEQVKIHFRYKASEAATVGTQIHYQKPSDYMHWQAIGNISFSTEWQEYDQTVTWPSGGENKGWSIAFNLNSENKNAIDFYFDDLSIQEMKLEHGLFIAGTNSTTGLEYDFDNAIQFEYDEDYEAWYATIGTEGKQDTWVNEVMISTVRGNDRAFKSGTLKPTTSDQSQYVGEEAWADFTESSNAKIKLPAGVYEVFVDTESKQLNFVQIEGEAAKEKLEEKPNKTEIVVVGQEREPTASEQPADEEAGIAEGTGQPWDNQFWIVANRNLDKGEVTILKFKYKSTIPAKTSTQLHNDPGAYMHYGAIGDVNFEDGDWQEFSTTFTVPAEGDGMKSIAFNMAEIKEANNYYITDVVWMTEDMTEYLVNPEGTANFWVKEGAGTAPYEFGHKPADKVPGDVNGDKEVNSSDVVFVYEYMAGDHQDADKSVVNVNGDEAGEVNSSDIVRIYEIMAGGKK